MPTCEDLGQATGVENHTMIQQTSISEITFNSRSVFVIAVGRILEGERDYREQTVATLTFQRLHVLRGVVIMVLVSVKLQVVESMVFSEKQKYLRTIKTTRILYFIVL